MSPYKKGRLGKWAPIAKWWAAAITVSATIVTTMWTGDGINTDEEKTLIVGSVAGLLLAYVVPKDTDTD